MTAQFCLVLGCDPPGLQNLIQQRHMTPSPLGGWREAASFSTAPRENTGLGWSWRPRDEVTSFCQ